MKLNRIALVAGVLALGVAACGDDVEIVQPTPPTPPPPPPVEATMAPASASVAVGNSVVFAVNASGGVAGDAASWTCASSNTGIATVTQTSAGCSATGVAAGDVTITASVTKSGETVNVGAQLTVTADAPPDAGDAAFILISSITDGDDDDGTLSGRVDVVVSVERGDATLEQLSVLVDGEAVASQSFGTSMDMGMTPEAEDAAAEQAVHEFTFSFDSDSYVDHGDHADVDYMNGEHTISAELQVAGGMMADGMMGHETISSNVITVEFDNDDGFVVSANLGQASMLDDDGRRWYGGPLNGDIMISALAVIYSGEEIGEVAISLAGCDGEEAAGDGNGNGADDGHDSAGETFEFDCEGEDAGRAITVTEGGNDANVLNADDLPDAHIDMEGPAAAPYFVPNPNNRQNGWVNLAVLTATSAGEHHATRNEDGWLTYNDADDEPGVGGYQPVLRYAKGDDIEDALAAAPLSPTNLPSESEMDAYCAIVSAVDNLGNESDLPDDDGSCLTAGIAAVIAADGTVTTPATEGSYEALLEALRAANALPDDVAPATTKADSIEASMGRLADTGLLAGVDITPPGIEIDEDERINAVGELSFDFDIYDDENDEANSGLHSLAPLLVRIQRRTTDKTECLDIGSAAPDDGTAGQVENGDVDPCTDDPTALADGTAITFGTDPVTSHAYYTLSGSAVDQAGNFATPASHTFVFDATAATATAPAAPGSLEAGESFQIASFLNDDLSIRDYYVTANFPDVGAITPIRLGIVAPTVVDAFDAASLTHRNFSVTADIDTYAGLQENQAATDVLELATVSVAVRDQGDSDGTNDATNSAALTVEDADDPFEGTGADAFTVAFTSDPTGDATGICVADDIDDCDDANDERETELEVVVTAGATGAFSDPFERVDFWVRDVNGASWMLGSDTSGDSGRVSGTDRTRTWTYSLDATAADLYMLTREEAFTPTTDSDSHTVLAFGVNDDGIALVSSVTIDIDDGEADQ